MQSVLCGLLYCSLWNTYPQTTLLCSAIGPLKMSWSLDLTMPRTGSCSSCGLPNCSTVFLHEAFLAFHMKFRVCMVANTISFLLLILISKRSTIWNETRLPDVTSSFSLPRLVSNVKHECAQRGPWRTTLFGKCIIWYILKVICFLLYRNCVSTNLARQCVLCVKCGRVLRGLLWIKVYCCHEGFAHWGRSDLL